MAAWRAASPPHLRRPRAELDAPRRPRSSAPPPAGRRSLRRRRVRRRQDAPAAASSSPRARERGARVLLGQCLELGGAQIPYAPLVAALRPLARGARRRGGRDAAGADAQRARRAAARAGRHRDARRRGAPAPARAGCSRRCSRCSSGSAAPAPVLLAIEDLHWADGVDARLHHLPRAQRARGAALPRRHLPLRRAAPPPPAAPAARRARARRRRRPARAGALRPRRARPSSSRASCRSRPRPTLAERLYGRSQGNPLYTEELLAALRGRRAGCCPRRCATCCSRASSGSRPAAPGGRPRRRGARPADHARAARGRRRPDARRGHGGRARGGRPPGARHRRRRGIYAFRHALVGEAIHGDLLPGEDTALHAAHRRGDRGAAASCSATSPTRDGRRRARLPLEERARARPLARRERPGGLAAKRVHAYEVASASSSARSSCGRACPTPRSAPGSTTPRCCGCAATCAERARRGVAAGRADPRGARRARRRRPSRCAPPRSTSGSGNFLRAAGLSDEASPRSTARSRCSRPSRAPSARACSRRARASRCCCGDYGRRRDRRRRRWRRRVRSAPS